MTVKKILYTSLVLTVYRIVGMRLKRKDVFALLLYLFCLQYVSGQNRMECNTITKDMGFMVRSVQISGRWVPEALQMQVNTLVGVGQRYDPAKVAPAQEMVRTVLVKYEMNAVIPLLGATSALFITSDVCDVSDETHPKAVDINIVAYYLRIDLFNVGNNVLPVPRSSRATFYEQVPPVLLRTSPLPGLMSDRRYGMSVTLQTSTDLLTLSKFLKQEKKFRSRKLNLDLNTRKSFSEPFHDLGAGLAFLNPALSKSRTGYTIGVQYMQGSQPLGEGVYKYELTRISASLLRSGNSSLFNKYAIGGNIGFLQNRFSVLTAQQKAKLSENAYELYALSDGRIASGFSRIGVWFGAGIPRHSNNYKKYQQLAGSIGYGITLGKGHNNVDLEVVSGTGYSWGNPPPYNQFFAGNTARSFLYEPFASVRNSTFPEGAVIRSLGERQGGLRTSTGAVAGGTSYWYVNLTVSIPIPSWIRPLIPDIVVSETPRRSTLADKLKGAVNFSKSWIIQDMIDRQGFPDNDQTVSMAEKIVAKDIRPTVNYLADRANVYAFKPLLFFDLANIGAHQLKNQTWGALGTGVQINVVNARLETGYVHTLFPSYDAGKGNFILRFTLQNFY